VVAAAAVALACTLGMAATARATTTYNVTAGDVTSLENDITSANTDNDDSVVNVPAGTYALVDGNGGAINVSGPSGPANLTVTDSTFTNNETAFSGEDGGAIFNAGVLTVERDTFSNNRSATNGSALASEPFAAAAAVRGLLGGNVTIVNTTFNDNTAGEDGQGTGRGTIYLDGNTVDLVNDTMAGNGDVNSGGNGDLFVEVGQANAVNTIIAGNTAGSGGSAISANCG
jgi:polymorphic membrane protein